MLLACDMAERLGRMTSQLLELFLDSPEFNTSSALVNSQLVCFLPVGIFNLFC